MSTHQHVKMSEDGREERTLGIERRAGLRPSELEVKRHVGSSARAVVVLVAVATVGVVLSVDVVTPEKREGQLRPLDRREGDGPRVGEELVLAALEGAGDRVPARGRSCDEE